LFRPTCRFARGQDDCGNVPLDRFGGRSSAAVSRFHYVLMPRCRHAIWPWPWLKLLHSLASPGCNPVLLQLGNVCDAVANSSYAYSFQQFVHNSSCFRYLRVTVVSIHSYSTVKQVKKHLKCFTFVVSADVKFRKYIQELCVKQLYWIEDRSRVRFEANYKRNRFYLGLNAFLQFLFHRISL